MKHIFLIGFMGCGKSSIGKKLSFQLKKPFTDLDSMVEVKEKRTINQIFEEDGEQSFRDMETSVLISMFDTKLSYVVATGGGLVMREKNRRIMKKQGIIIYLKASADTLYERLEGDEKRPLLQTEDPKAKIEQLLAERGPIYEKIADKIVEVDGLTPSEVCKLCVDAFEQEKHERRQRRIERESRNRILVMHGPNLNFLGIREPEIYGNKSFDDLMNYIEVEAANQGLEAIFFQSNHEGQLIDRIQEAYNEKMSGIIINPGALTHYSYALHDALASIPGIPKIEVHLSDITAREDFRKVSVTKDACDGQIFGKGFEGYKEALEMLKGLMKPAEAVVGTTGEKAE